MHGEANTFTLYITSQRSRYKIIRCTTFSWTCFEELGLSFTRKPNFPSHVYILQKLWKHMPLRGRGEGMLHSLNALKLDKTSGKNPSLYPLHRFQLFCFEREAPVFRRQLLPSRLFLKPPIFWWSWLVWQIFMNFSSQSHFLKTRCENFDY